MIQLMAVAMAWAAMQDPVSEAIDRAQKEFRMSLAELGPSAIPELEKRMEGPHRETIKLAIDEIRGLREPIEKLVAQLSAKEVPDQVVAMLELLKIGRPTRSYLEQVPAGQIARARADWVLRQPTLKPLKQPTTLIRELEMARLRERLEIQTLRVRAAEAEGSRGKATTLDLIKARRELEKARYQAGEITLTAYLTFARDRTSEELQLMEKGMAQGTLTALDALKVRIQLLYLDRRLGKEVGEELKKRIQEASDLLRLRPNIGFGPELAVNGQLMVLSMDANDDLD